MMDLVEIIKKNVKLANSFTKIKKASSIGIAMYDKSDRMEGVLTVDFSGNEKNISGLQYEQTTPTTNVIDFDTFVYHVNFAGDLDEIKFQLNPGYSSEKNDLYADLASQISQLDSKLENVKDIFDVQNIDWNVISDTETLYEAYKIFRSHEAIEDMSLFLKGTKNMNEKSDNRYGLQIYSKSGNDLTTYSVESRKLSENNDSFFLFHKKPHVNICEQIVFGVNLHAGHDVDIHSGKLSNVSGVLYDLEMPSYSAAKELGNNAWAKAENMLTHFLRFHQRGTVEYQN